MRQRRWWFLGGFLAFVMAVLGGSYAFVLHYHSNFREEIPGEFYRAGQMSPAELERYVKHYHIASVLNLRGSNADHPWWNKEVAAMDDAGVMHLDFRMSAKRDFPEDRARQLVDIMRNAPKPLLIHCNSGADRAGLAAAIYMAGVKKTDKATAKDQLSLKYGYLPFTFSTAWPMMVSFEQLSPMFGYELAEKETAR